MMTKDIIERCKQADADCLTKAFIEFLGRKPTPEDWKQVTLIGKEGDLETEIATYAGKPLGILKRRLRGRVYNVEFTLAPPAIKSGQGN